MTGPELACLHGQCSPFVPFAVNKREMLFTAVDFSEAKGEGKAKGAGSSHMLLLTYAPSELVDLRLLHLLFLFHGVNSGHMAIRK